ncbi:unnamed protein product, partial [Rotaria sordida]
VTPTLINRQILTSSPELSLHSESDLDSIQSSSSSDANTRSQSTFNRQQTFSKTTDNKNQTWVNPYWVASNNLTQNSWVNPYWGTKPSGKSTSSSEIKKSQASTVPQQDNWQYQNCSWKDKNASDSDFNITSLNESLSCEFKFTPIPSFYKRLYPPYPSSSSSIPIVDMEHYGILNQTIDDNEDIPFTIDRQGVAHYRAESSSSNIMNTTANIPSSSTPSQYP